MYTKCKKKPKCAYNYSGTCLKDSGIVINEKGYCKSYILKVNPLRPLPNTPYSITS